MARQKKLHIDFETASECDLLDHGLDRYARHPSTRALMLGWAIEDDEPKLWFPGKEKIPPLLKDKLNDPDTALAAHNAQFEDAIFTHVFKARINPRRYIDTMLMAYYCSLPGDLFSVCRIVGVREDEQKLQNGKKLINLFCKPRENITKRYPQRWLDETTHPEEWALFCNYCKLDVAAERAVYKKLAPFDLPDFEKDMIVLDRAINLRGMPVDKDFVSNALKIYKTKEKDSVKILAQMTGCDNPMSRDQFLAWAQQHGYPYGDLRKGTVTRALEDGVEGVLRDALELRAGTYKASLKKYDAIRRVTGAGLRVRYGFQYYGAQRTGRYAGRKVQLQNLARPAKAHEDKLDRITDLVRAGDADTLTKEFGNPITVLSSTVRSSFRAHNGKQLVISDLSSIEDRGLAWLAGCERILQEHRDGLDPYKAFGVYLYNKPYDALTKQERNDSKPGKLGCGYRLGPGGVETNKNGDRVKTGLYGYADQMGIKLTLEQCQRSVAVYRQQYPEIVEFWYALEDAVKECIHTKRQVRLRHLYFDIKPPFLRVRLPSGRHLHYYKPRLINKTFISPKDGTSYTKLTFCYDGVDSKTKKWGTIFSHGGKLAENFTQAIARDVLCDGAKAASAYGFTIVGHVHDELICEEEIGSKFTAEKLSEIMATSSSHWCGDMPLKAAGHECLFYQKD